MRLKLLHYSYEKEFGKDFKLVFLNLKHTSIISIMPG